MSQDPNLHQYQERFAADPDAVACFEWLEEHLFTAEQWSELADLYRQRIAAPGLAEQPASRAQILLRLGELLEQRTGDGDAAIEAFTEAVQLDAKLRRALRGLRRIYATRRSWDMVLQIAELELMAAPESEERAKLLDETGRIWQEEFTDADQANTYFDQARAERGLPPEELPPKEESPPVPADTIEGIASELGSGENGKSAQLTAEPSRWLESAWGGSDPALSGLMRGTPHVSESHENDEAKRVEVKTPPVSSPEPGAVESVLVEAQPKPTRVESDPVRASEADALARELVALEQGSAGYTPKAIEIRLQLAELRAQALSDIAGAIDALEPAREEPSALEAVADRLADLYGRAGRTSELVSLCLQVGELCSDAAARVRWFRQGAASAMSANILDSAIDGFRRVLEESPRDNEATSALLEIHRRQGAAEPLAKLLYVELNRAERSAEIPIHLELAELCGGPLGDRHSALAHLRRVLELDASHGDVLDRALGLAESVDGPFGQLDLLEHLACLAAQPTALARLLSRRGGLLADSIGWHEEALQSWRASLELDPQQTELRDRLARLEAQSPPVGQRS